jgi:hypothetical protein
MKNKNKEVVMPNDLNSSVDQLIQLSSSQNNNLVYPSESSGNKFFALDLKEKPENNRLDKNKRKFVCVELLNDKLYVKNYSNKELARFLESDKKENGDIVLAFYVKNSEKQELARQIEKKLKKLVGIPNQTKVNRIKEHFENFWKNFKPFDNYHDITETYDQYTGEPIVKATEELFKMYKVLKDRFEKLNDEYGERSEKYKKILNELKSVLESMEVKYEDNRNNFNHLSTDTVASVVSSFKGLIEKFDKKSRQLEIENTNDEHSEELELLENNLIKLQTECKSAIPSGASCTEEIFEEKNKISDKINFLLESVQNERYHTTSALVINGLKRKYNDYRVEFDNLKGKINNLQANSESSAHRELGKCFSKEIGPISEAIQAHLEKTSPEKASVLNKILDYLVGLKERIENKVSIKDINAVIIEIKSFINEKLSMLASSRGFFKGAASADLVRDLNTKLDNLASKTTVSDQDQNSASVNP